MAKKKQVEVIEGEKISPEEFKKLDPAKQGDLIIGKLAKADVEGQYEYYKRVECPWCYSMVRCLLDTERYYRFLCPVCSNWFRAAG